MSHFIPVQMRERMIRETEQYLNGSLKEPGSGYRSAGFAACRVVRRPRQATKSWSARSNPVGATPVESRGPKQGGLVRWVLRVAFCIISLGGLSLGAKP